MSDLSGRTFSHYRIIEKLGTGGMGEVFRAEDTKLGRPLALKFLPDSLSKDPEALERFHREARAASAIGHPNICTIYEIGDFEGSPFIAMELVEGQTLAQKLKAGALDVAEALSVARQLGEALEEAHEHNIIHRDLKPANVIISAKGRAKILDFGLAKLLQPVVPESSSTQDLLETKAGAVMGTMPYMAPEQLRGEAADARTDLYAFGGVLYEMVTGHRPFREAQAAQLIASILTRAPAPPHELNEQVPPGLESVILKALAKDRSQRYQTARELLADLGPSGSGSQHQLPIMGETAWLHSRPRRVASVIIVAGLLVAALAGLFLYFRGFRGRGESVGALVQQGIPARKQLAVLPFSVRGQIEGDDAFSHGLAEILAAKLTQLSPGPTLQVVPASEVIAQHVTTAKEARREFGVNLVMVGSLERAGDRVRVTYALVDPFTERQLTAASMTLATSDPFGIEDSVVEGAAKMLGLVVQPAEGQPLTFHGTQAAAAFQNYTEGLGYLQNYERVENLDKAIGVFQAALNIDPAYALAYAGLGQAYLRKYQTTKDTIWVDHARQSCDRAVTLDAKLPASHLCLAELESSTGEYAKAAAEFERVIATEPTNTRAYAGLADVESRLGKNSEAEQTFLRAIRMEPNYWGPYLWLGNLYVRMADYPKAAEMYRKVMELAPENQTGYYNLGAVFYLQGRWPEAEAQFRKSTEVHPSAAGYSNLGTVIFYQGHYAEAARWFEKATQLSPKDETLWGNLADAYRWTPGEQGRAPETYAKAIAMVEGELGVNPRLAEEWAHLGLYSAKTGQLDKALHAAREALQLAPDDGAINYYAATVFHLSRQRAQSIRCLKRAIAKGYPLSEIRADPEWMDGRDDQEFNHLVQGSKS